MENSSALFIGSIAEDNGRVIFYRDIWNIKFTHHSKVIFNFNTAKQSGGAMILKQKNNVTIKGYSVITFESNQALLGAICLIGDFDIIFYINGIVVFNCNKASKDDVILLDGYSNIAFKGL